MPGEHIFGIAAWESALRLAEDGSYGKNGMRLHLAQNYPFTPSDKIRQQLNCTQGTIRRRVLPCRNKIEELARNAGDPQPSTEAVIENIQWRGYRLNPDRIRIVAITELGDSD